MYEGRQGRKPGDPAQMEGIYSYIRNGHKWPITRRIIFLLNFKALMRFAGSWRRFADRVWRWRRSRSREGAGLLQRQRVMKTLFGSGL